MSKETVTTSKERLREAIERAIMQLTSLGANDTNYLRYAIKEIQEIDRVAFKRGCQYERDMR